MSNLKDFCMKYVFLLCAYSSILSVILICLFLFINGLPSIFKIGVNDFIFGTNWKPLNDLYGIFPMIVGSIYVTALAIVIGVPIGIITTLYLVFFASPKICSILKPVIDLLAGIPSIVYGFFGLIVIVPILQVILGTNGKGVLTAAIILGIMILPTIIGISEAALRAVPKNYYEGAVALGASHERSVFFVVLPAAKSGVLASVVLGIGRAIGETMAVIMVAGNQPIIPDSISSGVRTLTANIVLEMGYATGLHRNALIATSVVLFVFILLINLTFSIIKGRQKL
ncbi:MAG: phosphate ABC transporter permease subunit PstC [Succinivibrionaceae bacterium]